MGKLGEMGVAGLEPGVMLPFRLRENFLGFVDFVKRVNGEVGLASPLLWVESVATVAREEGILELLLWGLLSGEIRIRGVEYR
jgi:hypothetical protein